MQVFEFHFNPPQKSDRQNQIKSGLLFDSFCFEPENIYEKRMGSLYMVGVLKNAMPHNIHFLDRLAKVIKERYYRSSVLTPEKSLKEGLKEANQFLEQVAKKGDISWLGNLSFAAVSLKSLELNFTKVGDLKILLFRDGQIVDIDQKLKFEEIAPWPLKIFGNIVAGKLAENDVILVLTKEVLETFQRQNLLNKIAKIFPFDAKKVKEILELKSEELSKISGLSLLIYLSKEILNNKKEIISSKPRLKKFALKEIFSPFFAYFRKSGEKIKSLASFKNIKLFKKTRGVKKAKKETVKEKRRLPSLKITKFEIHISERLKALGFPQKIKKNFILIFSLIFFLLLGFILSEIENKKEMENYQKSLDQIQETVNRAESFLVLSETSPQAKENASLLFKESWDEISPLVKIAPTLPESLNMRITSLGEGISKNLFQLNNLVEIEEPELVFEFNQKEFVPQKMILDNENIFFFNPFSQSVLDLSLKNKKGEIYASPLQKDSGINSADLTENLIIFFSKPDKLLNFQEEKFGETFSLELPYSDAVFTNFSSFKSNLYFLDKETGEITKYSYLGDSKWDFPQVWLYHQTKKAIDGKSMAVDGSVWILNKNNSISRYYAGTFQETITLDIFPKSKDFSKFLIAPGLPYLYFLEPVQKRIVITDKEGKIVRQFQSEKFDNLLDLSVSENGKTIYLLNGLKVYKIAQ